MFASLFYWILILASLSATTQSAKILGISCFPAVSHLATLLPIWKELSLRGHQVTALISDPLRDERLTNLTEIDISDTYEILRNGNFGKNAGYGAALFYRVLFTRYALEDIMVAIFENEEVKKLIADEKQEFDIILVEPHSPLAFAFAARFKAPVVGISSLGVFLEIHDALGNPSHPVTSPDLFFDIEQGPSGPLFSSKLSSFLYSFWYRAFYYWYLVPRQDAIARRYFGNEMPYLGDLVKNISLLLINVNPIIHPIRANVPKIIEIGQLHITNEKRPLPKDLQEYLEKSEKGVIYFSLGTNVLISNMQQNTIQIIADALEELPYDVIWKWEKNVFTIRKPKNVMLRKWLPQQDLLGHPNLKVFVTQGGIQSTEEAIFSAVPMVGLPFLGDQNHNVRTMEKLGIMKGVDTTVMTKENLRDAILQVAGNQSYKDNILKVRQLLDDQPIKGVDKAVWWIEYVIRHQGADHLQAPTADMSFFQYFMVDVVLFISCSTILTYLVVKFLLSCLCNNRNKKTKTD